MADEAVLVEEPAAGIDVLGGGTVVDAADPGFAALLRFDRLAGGAEGVDDDPALGLDGLPS